MKKLITLILVLTGMVSTASAGPQMVYLKPGLWDKDGATFKVEWYTDNSNGLNNLSPTSVEGLYYTMVPQGTKSVTFKRCSSDGLNVWNTTDNIHWGVTDQLYCEITGWEQSNNNVSTDDFYLIYNTSYWYGDNNHVISVKMEGNYETGFKATLDNETTPASQIYYAIAPKSALNSDKNEIITWNQIIFPSFSDAAEANPYVVKFLNMECDAATQTWARWKIDNVFAHFDIKYNHVSKKWSSNPYIERTLSSAAKGYATFSSLYDVIPDATLASVQYATGVSETGEIDWQDYPSTGIKAGQGALLKGVAGSTYKFTAASENTAVAPSSNIMKPNNEAGTIYQVTEQGYTNYVLTKVSGALGFYMVNSTSGNPVKAGTAYLQVPNGAGAREFFALDDETTGIDAAKQEVKMDGEVFNLAGQRVAQPTKGLYIVNGKKVIIK